MTTQVKKCLSAWVSKYPSARVHKMKVERFEDLICWQKARAVTSAIYDLTRLPSFGRDLELVRQVGHQASACHGLENLCRAGAPPAMAETAATPKGIRGKPRRLPNNPQDYRVRESDSTQYREGNSLLRHSGIAKPISSYST